MDLSREAMIAEVRNAGRRVSALGWAQVVGDQLVVRRQPCLAAARGPDLERHGVQADPGVKAAGIGHASVVARDGPVELAKLKGCGEIIPDGVAAT